MITHLEGDCRNVLPTLPAKSVQCTITSPPYWAQRSYLPADHPAKHREIGREATAAAYIETLVSVFRQVARVLMNNGTLWINVGDRYATDQDIARRAGVKQGDLIGLPWKLALALQAEGLYLRSSIIWNKTNGKPESPSDRPTKSHEYLFLLSKRRLYHYDIDALREPVTSTGGACFGKQRHSTEGTGAQSRRLQSASQRNHPLGKNKRSVWSIPVARYPGAHFATFPIELIRPCILAGCPKGGVVLDPFAGAGTVAVAAEELGRDAVLIELNPAYITLQQQRLALRAVVEAPRAPILPAPPMAPTGQSPPPANEQGSLWSDV